MACTAGTSWQAANPLSSGVKPIPAFAAWRLSGGTAALLRRSPLRTGRAAPTASRLKQPLWNRGRRVVLVHCHVGGEPAVAVGM